MNIENDPFGGHGIRVTLPTPEHFLIVCESLTRMGIGNLKTKTLYQSAHLLHKKRLDVSHYAVLSFKELFKIDGRTQTIITEDDYTRRNLIVKLLSDWKLIEVVDKTKIENLTSNCNLKVISAKEKREWNLIQKYTVGVKKNYHAKNYNF